MKVFLMKKGAVKCERLTETKKLPPFYRFALNEGLYAETQLAPRHHGEYYAFWSTPADGIAVYVYIEPERVWVTEWWIDDVLVRMHIGGADDTPAFLRLFPGGAVVPLQTPGDPHFAAEAKFCVLDELTLQSPWHRKAIYKRAEVVYYSDPPAQPLKRLLDV